jgi:Immunity protein Imm1
MRKSCSFHEFYDSDWPSPNELEKYFSGGGRLWASHGNDNWVLRAEGLYGTAILPRPDAVDVDLRMMGSLNHGVTLDFARWHGRIRRLDRYCSVGDLRRLGQFMYSLQGDPYSLGLFIPFEEAFKAVKEFIESDGELPTSIGWLSGKDLLPERFPVPTWPPQKLPG